MNERVLVSGASIAGLTLAHFLARSGFRPTVVERAPAVRPGGNGVDVRGRALDVVGRIGIRPAVEAAAADVRGLRFVDDHDRTTARFDLRTPDSVEVMRGDLVALLHARADVEFLFDDTVTALRQDPGGVDVEFARAAPRRFDLVVGADGLHSAVRRLAFGPEQRYLRFKGHYFAFADADAALGEDRCVTLHNSPGKVAGLYRSGTHEQAKAYFMFRSAPLDLDHRDTDRQRLLLREAFGGDTSWRVPELLEGALADPEFYFDALSQVALPDWSAGRVVLVGDAAWCASPASGAGAELALVGADRLAGALAAHRGDHRAAFSRYLAEHRSTVRRRQRIGPNVRLMVPRTAAGARARDALAGLRGRPGPAGRPGRGESGA
ncbi:FAD-dependent monooxygenase [Kitasatospora sp. NPDC048365]|uniref:FAD-dependent monooxygenase n=1 Tax=Kitasatospora sp. NPDC048365 TaxID=3364050 RepID=UPI0037231ED0